MFGWSRHLIWSLGLFSFVYTGMPLAEAAPLQVAVELSALSQADVHKYQALLLYRKLLGRILQAGFAIHPPKHKTPLRVTLRSSPTALVLQFTGGGASILRKLPRTQRDIAQYHLEVLHKSLSILRRLRRKILAQKKKERLLAKRLTIVRMPTTTIKPSKPKPPNRWFAEIEVGALVLYRLQGADFQGRLGLRWGQERGFGIHLGGFLTPSIAKDITIIEWGLQLGPTWRQPLASAFSIEFGLLAGFVHHLYYFALGDEGQNERFDFVGNLMVLGNWHITKAVGLRLWLGLGMTLKSLVHLLDNVTIWERSLLRLEAGIAITLAF